MTTTLPAVIPMQMVRVGEYRYGLVVGREKIIVTETDFIHFIADKDEAFGLKTDWRDGGKEESFTLEELLARAEPMNLSDFGHYWGIKPRVGGNYALLRKSMREIGVSDKAMPKFGDR